MLSGSGGINSSGEAQVRFLMDFCELNTDSKQQSKETCRALRLGRMKPAAQPGGKLVCESRQGSFQISSYYLLTVDGEVKGV